MNADAAAAFAAAWADFEVRAAARAALESRVRRGEAALPALRTAIEEARRAAAVEQAQADLLRGVSPDALLLWLKGRLDEGRRREDAEAAAAARAFAEAVERHDEAVQALAQARADLAAAPALDDERRALLERKAALLADDPAAADGLAGVAQATAAAARARAERDHLAGLVAAIQAAVAETNAVELLATEPGHAVDFLFDGFVGYLASRAKWRRIEDLEAGLMALRATLRDLDRRIDMGRPLAEQVPELGTGDDVQQTDAWSELGAYAPGWIGTAASLVAMGVDAGVYQKTRRGPRGVLEDLRGQLHRAALHIEGRLTQVEAEVRRHEEARLRRLQSLPVTGPA